jgi:hypothetical protein
MVAAAMVMNNMKKRLSDPSGSTAYRRRLGVGSLGRACAAPVR